MEELSQSMGWPKGLTGKVFPGGGSGPLSGYHQVGDKARPRHTHTQEVGKTI